PSCASSCWPRGGQQSRRVTQSSKSYSEREGGRRRRESQRDIFVPSCLVLCLPSCLSGLSSRVVSSCFFVSSCRSFPCVECQPHPFCCTIPACMPCAIA